MADLTIVPPAPQQPSALTLVPPPKAAAPGNVTLVPPTKNAGTSPSMTLVSPSRGQSSPSKPPSAPPQSFGDKLAQNYGDIPREIGAQGAEGLATLKEGLTNPSTFDRIANLVPGGALLTKAGQGAAQYLFAPLTGAATSIAGRPLEAAERYLGITKDIVGGPPNKAPFYSARDIGDISSAAVPIGGDGSLMRRAGRTITEGLGAVRDSDAARALGHIFSPTTASPEAGQAERTIRRATGEGDIAAERAAQSLLKDNKIVGNLPVDQQRALVNYIENRGRGVPIPDPKLQKSADAIANVYDTYRKRIEYVLPPESRPSFIADYYSHLWKEKPQVVADTLNTMLGRQGSGRSFKARSIPTIADGIQAGLTPRIENPIENTLAYTRNMSRFLATHDIQNELRGLDYAKFFAPGKSPPGWVPLDGILTEKTAAYMRPAKPGEPGYVPAGTNSGAAITPEAPQAHPMKMYVPADVARVYNNFISKGFEHGDGAPIWAGARMAANAMTGLKLGLSTFHLSTMANEGIVSEVARGLQAASRGDLGTASRAIAAAPAAPVRTALRGKRMGQELLGIKAPDSISAKVNDAFVRSGGRLRMDPFYNSHGSGSFYQAFRRGTFTRELKDAASQIYHGTPYEKSAGTVGLAARAIQTAAAPIFEMYVPAMKRGAFAARMEDWIRSNPAATQDETDRFAIKLSDSIDNRFGELVQDNLFWKRQMKQMAQIVLLSPTWNIGTLREIGGGLAQVAPSLEGLLKGKGITDKTAYVAALAAVTATLNAGATYLKTGTAPTGKDFMAYRTGGTDANSGAPERAAMPGYQKDVYAFGYDFPHHVIPELINKLNPALSTAVSLVQNKDYRGLPIYRPEGATPVPGEPTMFDYMLEQAMPISLGTFGKGQKIGSNISKAEEALAIRPAPGYIQDTQRQQDMQAHFGNLDWRKRLKADRREQGRYPQ